LQEGREEQHRSLGEQEEQEVLRCQRDQQWEEWGEWQLQRPVGLGQHLEYVSVYA
jgi:hypothetical protein